MRDRCIASCWGLITHFRRPLQFGASEWFGSNRASNTTASWNADSKENLFSSYWPRQDVAIQLGVVRLTTHFYKIFTDLVFVFIMYSLCSMALAACGPVYVCSLARRGSSSQKYCEAFHRTFPVPLSLPVLHFFYSFTNIIVLDSCDYLVFCLSSTVTSNDREVFLKSCAKCPSTL